MNWIPTKYPFHPLFVWESLIPHLEVSFGKWKHNARVGDFIVLDAKGVSFDSSIFTRKHYTNVSLLDFQLAHSAVFWVLRIVCEQTNLNVLIKLPVLVPTDTNGVVIASKLKSGFEDLLQQQGQLWHEEYGSHGKRYSRKMATLHNEAEDEHKREGASQCAHCGWKHHPLLASTEQCNDWCEFSKHVRPDGMDACPHPEVTK